MSMSGQTHAHSPDQLEQLRLIVNSALDTYQQMESARTIATLLWLAGWTKIGEFKKIAASNNEELPKAISELYTKLTTPAADSKDATQQNHQEDKRKITEIATLLHYCVAPNIDFDKVIRELKPATAVVGTYEDNLAKLQLQTRSFLQLKQASLQLAADAKVVSEAKATEAALAQVKTELAALTTARNEDAKKHEAAINAERTKAAQQLAEAKTADAKHEAEAIAAVKAADAKHEAEALATERATAANQLAATKAAAEAHEHDALDIAARSATAIGDSLKATQADLGGIKAQLLAAQSTVNEYKTTMARVAAEHTKALSTANTARVTAETDLKSALTNHQGEKTRLRSELERQIKAVEQLNTTHTATLARLKKEHDDTLQLRLRASETANVELGTALAQTKKALDDAKNDQKAIVGELKRRYATELGVADDRIAALTAQLEEYRRNSAGDQKGSPANRLSDAELIRRHGFNKPKAAADVVIDMAAIAQAKADAKADAEAQADAAPEKPKRKAPRKKGW